MSQTLLADTFPKKSLENMCDEINGMDVSSRIRAIELILHSLNRPAADQPAAPALRKRGRLSELKGIGKGTWEGIDIDQFIREERDSWDS
jgi:methyl coenzyme M reductase gamma subunit